MRRLGPALVTTSTSPSAFDRLAVGGVVAVTEELEPGAHREHDRAAGVRTFDVGA